MRGSDGFDFFSRKKYNFQTKKVYHVDRHTMGYLWTKYLKLRFLGLVPLVTRSVEKVALKIYEINYRLRQLQLLHMPNYKKAAIGIG